MAIVAVDPGVTGALCLYDIEADRLEVLPMPVTMRKMSGQKKLRAIIDEGELLSTLQAWSMMGAHTLFIEQVGGMPGQSAPAAFTFGHGYGAVRMAALAAGMALEAIPPSVWKAQMKVPSDKKAARGRASELLPLHRHNWALAKDDGKAEAALLALYAVRRTR